MGELLDFKQDQILILGSLPWQLVEQWVNRKIIVIFCARDFSWTGPNGVVCGLGIKTKKLHAAKKYRLWKNYPPLEEYFCNDFRG